MKLYSTVCHKATIVPTEKDKSSTEKAKLAKSHTKDIKNSREMYQEVLQKLVNVESEQIGL